MSYEIAYDKQFIKVSENQFIPMVLSGSNNCTEFTNGHERRARSWYPWNLGSKSVYSKEELIEYCEITRQNIIDSNNRKEKDSWWEPYSDSNFGYWVGLAIGGSTHKTTYGRFKGIFETGCRKALTVEQLVDNYVSVIVRNVYYTKSDQDKLGLEPFYRKVETGEELLAAIVEFNEIFKGTNQRAITSFTGMGENTTKYLRLKYFKTAKKDKVELDVKHYFTIVTPNKEFLVRKLRNGYRYTWYPYIKIRTEAEANRKAKKYGYEVKRVDEAHTFSI